MNITKGKVAKAQKVVVYGPEGIGKSTFASQFPDPLFIDTEGSTSNMDVARMDRPTSWQFLHQQVEWVINNRPCKTLVIDTVDWAERLGIDYITARGGKKSITSFGYGDGFVQLEEEFGKFLNRLSDVIDVGINVVLTAHAKIVRFEAPDEVGAYDRWELKLGNKTTAKTAALVKEWADMVLFLNYKVFSVATDEKGTRYKGQGGERVMYASHHPAWDAKNRHGLPDEMPMDYSQIAHIFNEQAIETVQETWTSQPQTTEQQEVQQQTQIVQEPQQQTNVATQPVQQTFEQVPLSEAPASVSNDTVELDPSIPQSLRDLMIQNNVTEQEIQYAVSKRGYYPPDTPITNYDPNFIEGVLVGAWDQVYEIIKELNNSIPFDN